MRLIILLFSSVFISIFSVSFIDKLIFGNPEQDCFGSSAWNNYQVSDKIPSNFKNFLNKTIFIVPELKCKILKQNIDLKNLMHSHKKIEEGARSQRLIQQRLNYRFKAFVDEHAKGNIIMEPKVITFRNYKQKDINLNSKDFSYDSLQSDLLLIPKAGDASASGYIDSNQSHIIFITGVGKIFFADKKRFAKPFTKNLTIEFLELRTNIKKIIKDNEFYIRSNIGVKDILIHKNKIYISYQKKLNTNGNCYNLTILSADLSEIDLYEYAEKVRNIFDEENIEKLIFNEFFSPISCIKEKNDYGEFSPQIAGGRIFPFNDNELLVSVGDFKYRDKAQDPNSVFGKILKINIQTKDMKIISMGHRNPQGLSYHKEHDMILLTEHGPVGGDEINIFKYSKSKGIENFGWPISSYGYHYNNNFNQNDKAPLHKSHKDYGFNEPLKQYSPAIGISEIVHIPEKFDKSFSHDYFVAAMGDNKSDGDLSFHHIKISYDHKKIIYDKIIFLNERVRDINYVKDLNIVLLFLESSGSIGVIRNKI